MNARFLRLLIVAAALTAGSGVYAADAAGDAKAAADKAKAAATDAAKKDQEKFNTQAAKMIASREALAKQLKDATDEQRKVIFQKMKDLDDQQRELNKQFRDEFRKLLRSQGTPGRN